MDGALVSVSSLWPYERNCPTLRSVLSLNNPQNSETKFGEIWSWDVENYHNIMIGYTLNNFITRMKIVKHGNF
jgi:hypothetical protein